MQEIQIDSNNSKLKILINDYPNLAQMTEEDLKLLAARLELEISLCMSKKPENRPP